MRHSLLVSGSVGCHKMKFRTLNPGITFKFLVLITISLFLTRGGVFGQNSAGLVDGDESSLADKNPEEGKFDHELQKALANKAEAIAKYDTVILAAVNPQRIVTLQEFQTWWADQDLLEIRRQIKQREILQLVISDELTRRRPQDLAQLLSQHHEMNWSSLEATDEMSLPEIQALLKFEIEILQTQFGILMEDFKYLYEKNKRLHLIRRKILQSNELIATLQLAKLNSTYYRLDDLAKITELATEEMSARLADLAKLRSQPEPPFLTPGMYVHRQILDAAERIHEIKKRRALERSSLEHLQEMDSGDIAKISTLRQMWSQSGLLRSTWQPAEALLDGAGPEFLSAAIEAVKIRAAISKETLDSESEAFSFFSERVINFQRQMEHRLTAKTQIDQFSAFLDKKTFARLIDSTGLDFDYRQVESTMFDAEMYRVILSRMVGPADRQGD